MSSAVHPKRKIVINPTTGQPEYVSDNNFSYEKVPQNKKLTIHENQQMVIHDEFQADGDVDLNGSLILEE